MARRIDVFDIPLRTVVNGVGFSNLFSPNTPVNPHGWLLLRQFTKRGPWYPAKAFPLSQTYSALAWYVRATEAFAGRPGHDGVRLVFADGSLVAQFVKFSTKKAR